MPLKKSQQSLKSWTQQKWRTKSGKPSAKTGERYLPSAAIKSLTPAEYAATTKAKREGTAKGKQFVKQPKSIAEKTRKFRAAEGGLAMYGMKNKKEDTKGMGMKKGGTAMKKKGYAKGGMVAAGASNPATQKRTPKK